MLAQQQLGHRLADDVGAADHHGIEARQVAQDTDRLRIAFWVGVEQQAMLTGDERYEIPKYMGHNGWISLDVSKHLDEDEVRELASFSYRHFALRRMLQQLGDG